MITASPGNRFFKVGYLAGGGNVTAMMTAAGYRTGILEVDDPGEVIRVKVKPVRNRVTKKIRRGNRRIILYRKKGIALAPRSVSEADSRSFDSGLIRVRIR